MNLYDKYIIMFNPDIIWRIKFFLFGKRTVEYAGSIKAEWVEYYGKLYLIKYSRF